MKRRAPLTLALIVLVAAALAISLFAVVVLYTTPVAQVHVGFDNAEFLGPPLTSELAVNESFPTQSGVAFHWTVDGIVSGMVVSVEDPDNGTVYSYVVSSNGSVSGSGFFVSEPGVYRFVFGQLTYGVAGIILDVQFTYVTQSPLL